MADDVLKSLVQLEKDIYPYRLADAAGYARHAQVLAGMDSQQMQTVKQCLTVDPWVRWRKLWRFAIAMAISPVVVSFLLSGALGPTGLRLAVLWGVAAVLTVLAGVFFLEILWQPLLGWYVDCRVRLLELIEPASGRAARCKEALDWVQSHPELARFRDAVLARGRELTLLDLYLMEAWANTLDQEQSEAARKEQDALACKQLHGLA